MTVVLTIRSLTVAVLCWTAWNERPERNRAQPIKKRTR
jgi:hypothetical protein